VEQHRKLVYRLAHRLARILPRAIDLSDLTQIGFISLLQAWEDFDSARGAQFKTYAAVRIRGAMLDEVRRQLQGARSLWRQSRAVKRVRSAIENELGRAASNDEVAARMGVSRTELDDITVQVCACLASGEGPETETVDAAPDQFEQIANQQFREALSAALSALPAREQEILRLLYWEGRTQREIAVRHRISESMVSQLCAQAMRRLREQLAERCGSMLDLSDGPYQSAGLAEVVATSCRERARDSGSSMSKPNRLSSASSDCMPISDF
jgi:RNA polymerase sigma factor FliA